MTDSELQGQYAGYSDQQLAEFIASNIPEWQAEQFSRLLMLRRREHYLKRIDAQLIISPPSKPSQKDQPFQLPPEQQPAMPTEGKRKSKGCGCLALMSIILIIVFLIISFIVFEAVFLSA